MTRKDARIRVLHSPNLAGLGGVMAQALRSLGVEATSVSYMPHPYGFKSDIELNLQRYPRAIKGLRMLMFAVHALRRFDLFHFHYGTSLLPMGLDLPIIRSLGRKIAVHFHGSDIRNPRFVLHAADRYRTSQPLEGSTPPLSTAAQLGRVATWEKYANFMFVSTPDLLTMAPNAVYIAQPIDLSQWQFVPKQHPRLGPLVVLHLPSHQGMKGTEFVLKSIQELSSAGYDLELRLAEGRTRDEVQQLYRDADIVIDQLLIGAYGLVSVEAMAVGRPVICYISDAVRSRYPGSLPVVSATPLDLTDALATLMDDANGREQLAYEGRKYVDTCHDARIIARRLLDYYSGP